MTQPDHRLVLNHTWNAGRVAMPVDVMGPAAVVRCRAPEPATVPYIVPPVPAHERHEWALRQNAQPVHTMVSAPRPIRLHRERRRRRELRVVAVLVIALAIAVGAAAAGLMANRDVPPLEPTNAWAADASGCLTNTVTGAVACPVVEGE